MGNAAWQNVKELGRTIIMIISVLIYHNRRSKVLYYHDVHNGVRYTSMSTPIALFERHLDEICKSGYKVVRQITQNESEIQITFDDGFRGIWDNRSFFIKNHIPVTIFIATSQIGQEGYLTEKEIIELPRSVFDIQSHTVTHRKLTNISKEEVNKELLDSKHFLEELLEKKVEGICVPIGAISESVYQQCLLAGYSKVYSSIPGNYSDKLGNSNSLIFRNLVQHQTILQLSLTLRGGKQIFRSKSIKSHFKLPN